LGGRGAFRKEHHFQTILENMENLSLYSSLFLTLLIVVGLFFFIRASVKDRTEREEFTSSLAAEALAEKVKEYLEKRTYSLAATGDAEVQVYEGVMQPSKFLAVFLSFAAFLGLVCLSLVFGVFFPQAYILWYALPFFCPVAGLFYWKKARKTETVRFKIMPTEQGQTKLKVEAHRDELATMNQALQSVLVPQES
jgi:ABC-type transport system involved in cytochrome bd biosynthesis fused ATPase/permease subunit